MHSRQIHSIQHALSNLKQGDVVFFDIDDTLLLTGLNKYQDPVKLTEERIDFAIKNIQEIGIPVLGLTARKPQYADATVEQLKSCQITLDNILYAPSNRYGKHKGWVLRQYIQKHPDIHRAIVIDDNWEQIEDILSYCSDINLSFYLYHYQRLQCQRISHKRYFPSDLSQFNQAQSLGGGTQSTFKISSKAASLVLKFGASPDAIKMEILCNAIYAELGVKVPKMEAYNTLPKKLAQLKRNEKHDIVQVSEYIQSGNQDQQKIILTARNDFIIHVLLGNIDVAKWDNFIVDIKNQVYLIDAGDNFIFRALGEKRKEDARWITEMDSLRNAEKNKQAHAWFHDLSEDTIQQQVLSLIKKIPQLEKIIQIVMDKIELSDRLRMAFLRQFSERLDQLSLRYCPDNQLGAKPDKSARQHFTAAGVLTYTILNNEPYVLLSKRVRHEWWANFGGKSDAEDNYLEETAGREVFEESGGRIKYLHHRLRSCAFHDLITPKKDKAFVYRMYIAEHAYVDPKDIRDKEHTAHQWVPLKILLTASPTIEHENTTMTLYPPFYRMLQQPTIKEHLERLHHKQPLKLTHTQGSVKLLSDKGKLNYVFNSPEYMSQQINHSLIKHSSLLREFKLAHLVEAPKSNYAFDLTPSELHIKMILGSQYLENNLAENINYFIQEHLQIISSKITSEQRDSLSHSLLSFIENERDNHFLYFYHGVDKKVAFAYQIYSFFHQILQLNNNWHAFRAFNTYTGQFKSIVEFIAHYSDNNHKEINNDAKDFHECAIAANIFLLGNHNIETSNSLRYAIYNETRREVNLPLLLKNLFGNFFLSSYEIELFLDLFQKYETDNNGQLYQIGIPIEDVPKLTYPAGSLGRMNTYGEENLVCILDKIRKNFDENNHQLKCYLEHLQVRILVPPHQFFKVRALKAFDSALDTELKQLVEDITHSILKNTMDDYAAPIDSKTPMLRLFRQFYTKNQLLVERVDTSFALTQAILMNNNPLVLSILKKYPTYKTMDLSLPEDYLNHSKKSKAAISTLKMILFYSKLDKKTIIKACYDEDLPDVTENISAQQLLNILELLSANQCKKLMDDYYNRNKTLLITFAVSNFELFNTAWQPIRFTLNPSQMLSLIHSIIEAGNLSIFNLVWDDFSEEEKLSFTKTESKNELLHRAASQSHIHIFEILWAFYAKNQALLFCTMHQKLAGETIIMLAAQNCYPEIVHRLIAFYPQEDRAGLITEKNFEGDIALHHAARGLSLNVLLAYLEYLPETARVAALHIKNYMHNAPLDEMTIPFMANILQHFSIPDRLTILKRRDKLGSNMLIRLANKADRKNVILALSSIPKEQMHLVVFETNEYQKSFLDKIFSFSMDTMYEILNLFPEPLLVEFFIQHASNILQKNRYDYFEHTSLLRHLFNKLNEDQLREIFITHSILNKISFVIEPVISRILLWLPASIRSDILNEKNQNSDSILYKIVSDDLSFILLWKGLSDSEKKPLSNYETNYNLWQIMLHSGSLRLCEILYHYNPVDAHRFQVFLTSKAPNGNNIFHYLVYNPDLDLYSEILKIYPKEELYSALNQPNDEGESPLYLAVSKHYALCNIMLLSISKKISSALNEKQTDDNALFDIIIANKQEETLKIIFDNLPKNEFYSEISKKIAKDKIRLHTLISQTKTFLFIWEQLSIHERIAVAKEKTSNGYSLLHLVLLKGDSAVWEAIWKFYLDQEELIKQNLTVFSQNISLLHLSAKRNDRKSSQDILGYLSQNNRLDILYFQDNKGKTPLDIALSNTCLFMLFLKFLFAFEMSSNTAKNRISPISLAIKNSSGKVVAPLLDYATKQAKTSLLNEIFNTKDQDGKTFFHFMIQNRSPILVRTIYYFSEEPLIRMMNETSNYGNTALHFAATRTNKRKLKIFLNAPYMLPSNQLLPLLTKENIFGNTPLHLIAKNNVKSLWSGLQKFILHYFPEKYVPLLKLSNRFGKTLVHSAAENSNAKVLDRMLSYKKLSDKDRLELVNMQNMYGNTPLHRAAKNPNSELLAVIFKYLPEPVCEGKYQGHAFFTAAPKKRQDASPPRHPERIRHPERSEGSPTTSTEAHSGDPSLRSG